MSNLCWRDLYSYDDISSLFQLLVCGIVFKEEQIQLPTRLLCMNKCKVLQAVLLATVVKNLDSFEDIKQGRFELALPAAPFSFLLPLMFDVFLPLFFVSQHAVVVYTILDFHRTILCFFLKQARQQPTVDLYYSSREHTTNLSFADISSSLRKCFVSTQKHRRSWSTERGELSNYYIVVSHSHSEGFKILIAEIQAPV